MNRLKYISIAAFFLVTSAALHGQSFTLDECIQLTLRNNESIKQSGLEVQKAEQTQKEAFTHYFPNVSATGLAMKANDYLVKGSIPEMNLPVYDGNPANLLNPTQFAYFPGASLNLLDYMNTASVVVTQPVFAGGQIYNGNRLARVGSEIVAERKNADTRDQLLITEKYYWTLAGLIAQRKTVSSYHELLISLRKDVAVAYENGLVEKSDLLKVDLKLNEVEVNSLALENGIESVQRALCQQTGMEWSAGIITVDSVGLVLPPENYYIDPDSSLKVRPEYIMLSKAIDAASLQKKIAVGKNLPAIAVGATGFWYDVMDNSQTNALAFASVSIPISDWWGGSHQIRQKSLDVEKAKSMLADNSQKLVMQQQVAFNKLREAWKRIKLADAAMTEATEHLKVVADNHKAGMVGVSDLLEAQALWQQGAQQMAGSGYNYLIELATYKSLSDIIANPKHE
ncbi:MAG TPA: hypothetical protein DEO70_05505 [Bacteroidales bacterium]|nr:MAG: hypothetical protein A2X11_16815 [Bacteroidetes bacterium GWE2_42_24]OFY25152.1 MAG: hypothetical protein A2X09_04975 [Bacteroidetes bacterium GWF2_43_11]HBZ66275.1 hypothetical protein [Bacteroidales bacterium]